MGSNGAMSCLRRWGAAASIEAATGTAMGGAGRGARVAAECTWAWAWAAAFWSLTRQYTALMATEGVTVEFTENGIRALARIAAEVNGSVENIGARRLYTVIERVFEELSFSAPDRSGDKVVVDTDFVETHLGDLSRSADLSRYVL